MRHRASPCKKPRGFAQAFLIKLRTGVTQSRTVQKREVTLAVIKNRCAGYEHGQPIEAMKAAIEKLTFDGFALT
jgi:hypothetical protein